jgi:hypothetical protein
MATKTFPIRYIEERAPKAIIIIFIIYSEVDKNLEMTPCQMHTVNPTIEKKGPVKSEKSILILDSSVVDAMNAPMIAKQKKEEYRIFLISLFLLNPINPLFSVVINDDELSLAEWLAGKEYITFIESMLINTSTITKNINTFSWAANLREADAIIGAKTMAEF